MCVFVFVCVGFETWRVSAFVCMYVCVCWRFWFEIFEAVPRLFVGAEAGSGRPLAAAAGSGWPLAAAAWHPHSCLPQARRT